MLSSKLWKLMFSHCYVSPKWNTPQHSFEVLNIHAANLYPTSSVQSGFAFLVIFLRGTWYLAKFMFYVLPFAGVIPVHTSAMFDCVCAVLCYFIPNTSCSCHIIHHLDRNEIFRGLPPEHCAIISSQSKYAICYTQGSSGPFGQFSAQLSLESASHCAPHRLLAMVKTMSVPSGYRYILSKHQFAHTSIPHSVLSWLDNCSTVGAWMSAVCRGLVQLPRLVPSCGQHHHSSHWVFPSATSCFHVGSLKLRKHPICEKAGALSTTMVYFAFEQPRLKNWNTSHTLAWNYESNTKNVTTVEMIAAIWKSCVQLRSLQSNAFSEFLCCASRCPEKALGDPPGKTKGHESHTDPAQICRVVTSLGARCQLKTTGIPRQDFVAYEAQ